MRFPPFSTCARKWIFSFEFVCRPRSAQAFFSSAVHFAMNDEDTDTDAIAMRRRSPPPAGAPASIPDTESPVRRQGVGVPRRASSKRDLTIFCLALPTRAAQGERQLALVGGSTGTGKVEVDRRLKRGVCL